MSNDIFRSILESEFRWPRAGDQPFAQSERWQDNAYLDRNGHGRLVMMMTGYKEGADLMVKRTLDDSRKRDSLVFPIVFNYRQFIELSLKYLIATYGHTVGIQANWKDHELAILWQEFIKVLRGYGHRDFNEGDQAAAQVVAEFAKVDPQSFSYRYPVDKKGRPIPLRHDELNLAQLAAVMTALDNYFSGCDGYLDHLQGAGP
ncbi:MAG TPA: hypothetical protein VLK25_12230 [Allosphingosinicella sp.]|nr:hypothetical protein [Allosphingosinicella sp.]